MDHSLEKAQRLRFWTEDPRVLGIVRNVADGVIGIDTRGYVELFNPAAERLFGYHAGEVMGRNVKMLMSPDYADRHDGFIANYLATGQARIIGSGREVAGRRKDGSIFPMYLSVGDVDLPGYRGFVGIVHDLSAQKAAERELAAAGQFLQAIIDATPSATIGIDRDGLVTHWNRAAAEQRNIASEQAIGRHFRELFPCLDLQPGEIDAAIDQQRPIAKERLPAPVNGETRYLDVMVCPLQPESGGAVIRIDDVTDRVRMEEMMVQTEKMMSVGGLAAGMAHEINNPLGVITQGCQNLLRRVSPEIAGNARVAESLGIELAQVRGYLEQRGFFRFMAGMQEAAGRASRIVGDMLAYSRRSASSFVPARLNDLVDTVLRLAGHDYDLRQSYDFRRIRILREAVGESDEVHCDAMAIEQVLLNLLRNAAQAMAASPGAAAPQITVRTVDEGDWVRLEIADNGPGVTEEAARHLFEPFFTTKPVGIGTGLGLSVAYFIVTEQHRGTMAMESPPGQGARFVIRLPRLGRPYGSHDPGGR